MPKRVGTPLVFAMSTNPISREIANSLELASRVKASLHATASERQRDKIDRIITALRTVATMRDLRCPQPFYENYVVDKDKFRISAKRASARKAGRKRAK